MESDAIYSAITRFVIISEEICYLGIKGKCQCTKFIKIHILLKNEQMKYGINLMKKLNWYMIVFQSTIFKLTCMMVMLKQKRSNAKPTETGQFWKNIFIKYLVGLRRILYIHINNNQKVLRMCRRGLMSIRLIVHHLSFHDTIVISITAKI